MTPLTRDEAIGEMNRLLDDVRWIRASGHGSATFLEWKAAAEAVIRDLCGDGSRPLLNFAAIRYTPSTHSAFLSDNAQDIAFQRGLESACGILEALLRELEAVEG
jgi:hypothetical protein